MKNNNYSFRNNKRDLEKIKTSKLDTLFFAILFLGYLFDSLNAYMFFLTIIIYLGYLLLNLKTFRIDRLNVLIGLFSINIIISIYIANLFFSYYRLNTEILVSVIKILLILFICLDLRKRMVNYKIIIYIAFFYYFYLLYTYLPQIINPVVRFKGNFNDPNYFCLILLLFAYFSVTEKAKDKMEKTIFLSVFLTSCILILTTLSRSGILALIVFLLVYNSRKLKKILKIKHIFFFFLVIFLLFNIFLIISQKKINYKPELLSTIFKRFSMKSSNDLNSAYSRIYEIIDSFTMIKKNPEFLFTGIGYSSTSRPFYLLRAFHGPHRVHNTYFAVFVEQGIVGLIILFFIIMEVVRNLNRKSLGLFISALVLSFFVWNIYFFPFWLITLVITTHKNLKKQ